MTTYTLTAQPVDEHGRTGFDDPPKDAEGGVYETTNRNLVRCFMEMGVKIVNRRLSHPEEDCWDLTLTTTTEKE